MTERNEVDKDYLSALDTWHETRWGGLQMDTMQAAVADVNQSNGWFDKDRTFGDDIALLHSECSEALEAFRHWRVEDVTINECTDGQLTAFEHNEQMPEDHLCKPEGVGSELADVLVRLLDTCERYDIDLVSEFWRKVRFNATRGYRHGNRNL